MYFPQFDLCCESVKEGHLIESGMGTFDSTCRSRSIDSPTENQSKFILGT
jgi:hypothetical protein